MDNPNTLHFWQIHKKVYQREWLNLDYYFRKDVIANREGSEAQQFYAHVKRLAIEFYNDETHNYNARYRFQYEQ